MYDPTDTIKRLAGALFATVAMLIAVPVAQGFDGPPDAIDRYRANNEVQVSSTLALGGSPDAIDRYRENHAVAVQPAIQGSPDAIDRYNANDVQIAQPTVQGSPDAIDRFETNRALFTQPDIQGSPDALDRFETNRSLMSQPNIQGSPDAIDRYVGRTVVYAPSASGFDWGDFGIGAAAMFGLVLLATGLGLGALTVRHGSSKPATS